MEKEIELVHKMNRELGGISEKMTSIAEKIEENHEVHVENQKNIIETKDAIQELNYKVGIQNGRVTKNEKETVDLQKGMAEVMKLLSRHDGEIARRNKLDEENHSQELLSGNKYIELKYTLWTKIGYVAIGIIGFWLMQSFFPSVSTEVIPNLFK